MAAVLLRLSDHNEYSVKRTLLVARVRRRMPVKEKQAGPTCHGEFSSQKVALLIANVKLDSNTVLLASGGSGNSQ